MDDAAPVVVVELPGGERASPNVGTLLRACTVALRRGKCVLPHTESDDSAAEVTAVVTFQESERPSVLVELTANGDAGQSTSRQIVFRPEDSESERWRSIGFTIASLAGALGGAEPTPEPEKPAPHPPVEAPKPAPPRAPIPRSRPASALLPPFHLGARFELGPGLDRGPPRWGGAIVVGYDLPGRVLSAWALLGDASSPGAARNIDMSWMRAGVGLSAQAPLPAELEGRAALIVVAERIAAHETDPATQFEDSRSRWQSGVELDLALRWPRTARVGGVVGGYVVSLSGGTAVMSHGAELASSPGTGVGAFAGLEVRL